MNEIYPAKTKFWEPNIGDTFLSFLEFVKEKRKIKDPYDLQIIQNNAINIIKKCIIEENNSINKSKRTTLHLGEVQSGKTLAMCSVIALAYDNDFLISTVLTGTKNILKSQNQDRIREVLDAIDKGNKKFIYNSEPRDSEQLRTQLSDLVKKNKFIKKKKMFVFTMLKHQNSINRLSEIFTRDDTKVMNFPLRSLILDDEADQASPNTLGRSNERDRRNDRSTINKSIIQLRQNHPKFCTYIQVTATANPLFLIDKFDPMSPDFISISETPNAYIGIRNYFLTKKLRKEFIVKIEEEDIPDPDDYSALMPKRLQEAIDYFIVSSAICETFKEPIKPPFTMLCHPDWRKEEHKRYESWITKYIKCLKEELFDDETLEITFKALENSFNNAMKNLNKEKILYENVRNNIGQILESNISIRVINDRNPIEEKLSDFWNQSNYHIIIGGNCIERGFTVEGLIVTYISRDPGINADSIQQRARFCGFKDRKQFLLSRLWLDADNINFFRNYILTEETIRKNIQKNVDEYKPQSKIGYEMAIVKPFRLTRRNVHGELNIGDAKEWFIPKFSQYLSENDQNNNLNLFFKFYEKYVSSFKKPSDSSFRCFESNELKVIDLKNILKEYKTYEAENAPKNFYSHLIDCYPDEYKDNDPIKTYFMVDADFINFNNLKEYIENKKEKIYSKRNFKYPKKNINLPKTNLHRGAGLKKGRNWSPDNMVFSKKKITLQFILLKFGIANENYFNESIEIHNKINSLTNTNETMCICVKFPQLSNWRIFNS